MHGVMQHQKMVYCDHKTIRNQTTAEEKREEKKTLLTAVTHSLSQHRRQERSEQKRIDETSPQPTAGH